MSLLLIVWGWIGDKTKLVCYLIKSNERECLFVASLNERKKPRVFKSPHAEFKCFWHVFAVKSKMLIVSKEQTVCSIARNWVNYFVSSSCTGTVSLKAHSFGLWALLFHDPSLREDWSGSSCAFSPANQISICIGRCRELDSCVVPVSYTHLTLPTKA